MVRFVSIEVDVGPCEAYLVAPTGVSLLFIIGEPSNYGRYDDVRVVYNAGEQIAYVVSSGKADIYVGGFLLQLP